ncbi:MAG: class I SAM-dependent methyltransferase [Actinobacteria bacterium]|nr:class I SAM-dependent methyltransferase [Actinomycetota bacterium]
MGRGSALTPAGAAAGAPAGRHTLPVDRDPRRIAAMFGGIAPRYDLMNRLMTGGRDGHWRRIAARQAAPSPGDRVLDACCGTGDLSFTLADQCPGCEVVGLDFTAAMLALAREKAALRQDRGLLAPAFVHGDLLDLPFADGEFAAVTVGWGVRNVPDVPRAFAEMRRVTRPGGRIVCLESTQPPDGAGKHFHRIWMGRVVPFLGCVVTGDATAYAYLPASVEAFPRAGELAAIMAAAGFTAVRYRRLGFGAVAIHVGDVPVAAAPGAMR